MFDFSTEWFAVSYLNCVGAFVTRVVPFAFFYDCGIVQFDDVVGEIVDVRGPFGAYYDKERQNHDNGTDTAASVPFRKAVQTPADT